MSSSCMGKPLPKEKQFGVKVCRERKCPELQKDPKWPDSPERCMVFNQMPGSLPCCIKDPEMKPEVFLKCIGYHLHEKWEHSNLDIKNPGPKNCPDECPYKLSEMGEVFRKDSKGEYGKRPGKITRCAFTGEVLGGGGGSCMCHVLGNPDQEGHIDTLKCVIRAGFANNTCWYGTCPDGIERCKPEDEICPVNRLPRMQNGCPLWRIPAKLLPAPAIEAAPKPTTEPEKITENQKMAKVIREGVHEVREERKRTKKEKADPICEACRERMKGTVPTHACEWCREEQEQKGRRAWVTDIKLGSVLLGDMNEEGKRVPDQSVDVIFTDPPYIKELYQQAYADLAALACRVLKPHGFLFTYAPQAHLDEIMDMLRFSTDGRQKEGLRFFWIISSLNSGAGTAKAHKWNAICLHKPILVLQKVPEGEEIRGARRCFNDVIRGLRQKKYHPWQQSVHDVLGIISRFMDPGEILLDPFAGTGTSLIAGQLLGMDWIGFEIDPKTHAIAVRELQQQPMDLQAFGIEADSAECEREQVPEEKDSSKQGKFPEFEKTLKESREVCNDAESRLTTLGRIADKEAARVLVCHDCKNNEKCITHIPANNCGFRSSKAPDELPAACLDCEFAIFCMEHDPEAGCVKKFEGITGLYVPGDQFREFRELRDKKKPRRPKEAGTGGGPQPFVQHCCGTCGHHKGRKTFHDSCPRLGELLFKDGTKSAKVLMEETQREQCEHWISKAERIPNITWCSTIRNCPGLSWEDGVCITTGKKLIDQNYCPTQHLIEEKPAAPKKRSASKKSKTKESETES